ncbi:hypothetical protein HYDPIDRAFT_42715 [Hydnomerulius pinastri MD-312]|uniref:DNA repair protein rad9 n=1 Tax=Hydnomerulius pinastri MD-312 TaxID=994086 RepID=A0A0C9V6R2_9AGAM|nr:hypothetical protein HYDPIDRAFT_42715 [Hydnomerulius pinastri MD-312]
MQATLSVVALKPFVRALTCLSRYGDDLVIHADSEHLTLSVTSSSLSAYCRFRYGRMFFSRWRVGSAGGTQSGEGNEEVKGQLLAKTLLSILKHRTIEKTVERCELLIVEGAAHEEPDEDEDTLESRLIVRLHCKHGIIKTHRLPLLIPTSLLCPGVPDSSNESRLTIGPRAIKDITEHFPNGRGMKSDPQLVWTFGDTDVDVKSLESSIDTKGRAQLATELTISVDEFDVYEVHAPPTTIAFHLREFNATIAFAESMNSALDLRFTDPAAPLFIDVEGDESECLFVISTSQIQGAPSNSNPASNANANRGSSTPQPNNARKRPHPDAGEEQQRERSETPRTEKVKKSMKAVQRIDASVSNSGSGNSRAQSDAHSMPPPTFIPKRAQANAKPQSHADRPFASQGANFAAFGDLGDVDMGGGGGDVPGVGGSVDGDTVVGDSGPSQPPEPLFYPYSSQVVPPQTQPEPHLQLTQRPPSTPLFFPPSQASQAVMESGLGVEYMNREELEALLEGEGEEVEVVGVRVKREDDGDAGLGGVGEEEESLELFEDEFGPSQENSMSGRKAFQPLFED